MDTLALLQHYWWFLISLLGALLVFLLFVQGGQGLLYTMGRTEAERDRQFAGPQMGTHVHYAGNFRRRVFRLVPAFLLDQFRRGVLRLDADSAGLRPTSRFVRIPAKTQ